jgi:hypothetical protein
LKSVLGAIRLRAEAACRFRKRFRVARAVGWKELMAVSEALVIVDELKDFANRSIAAGLQEKTAGKR